MSGHLFDTCDPAVKRPVILIGGTADINFIGGALGNGVYINSAIRTAEQLAKVSGCTQKETSDGSAIRITTYSSCDSGVQIGLVELKGLDHDWFLGDGSAGVFDTATTIMQFFNQTSSVSVE